ncbi:acetamidase/formamidase family protein [Thermosynechococcaceae cyanobacterium Okahandja]
MPKTLFKVELTKPMDQQELPRHNRWHPDIPAVVSVNLGDVFRIEQNPHHQDGHASQGEANPRLLVRLNGNPNPPAFRAKPAVVRG